MAQLLTCPQGHQWEISAQSPSDLCPVCGAQAPAGVTLDPRTLSSPPSPPPYDVAEAATMPPTPGVSTDVAALEAVHVPGYKILSELGRGGMGVVYKAQQISAKRVVALKMILAGGHAGTDALERFRTEAEAIARLQHPHIVQIYEVGEHAGLPFFSLEFCTTGSLEKKLQGTPLPPKEAATLVEKLARGMQAAHEKGVIHRDLKPANVLLTEDGTPKITDFGLAKKLGEAGQTATGAVMGTPSYMAPEQAAGWKDIGPPADIYALGALLYEALTGRPPFVAGTPMDVLLKALECAPTPPQVHNPGVPHDLQTICLKCLEKEPRQRYATAQALADDLGRWLNGESIHARSYNLLDHMAAALDRSQYDVHFVAWGSMLLGFAAVIGLGHMATTGVLIVKPDERSVPLVTLIHLAMLAALLALFWRNRPEGLMPRTTAERQLWCVLGGFVAACALMGLVDRLMSVPERPHEPLRMYPALAVLSGLTFLVLGSSYWGACYLFAAGFWVLALMLPLALELGPAGFGMMWMVALVTVGRRLRRLGTSAGTSANRT